MTKPLIGPYLSMFVNNTLPSGLRTPSFRKNYETKQKSKSATIVRREAAFIEVIFFVLFFRMYIICVLYRCPELGGLIRLNSRIKIVSLDDCPCDVFFFPPPSEKMKEMFRKMGGKKLKVLQCFCSWWPCFRDVSILLFNKY